MKYKLVSRVNPQDRSKSKWYAAPINEGKITKTELAKEVVNISSLSRGDVSSVIENLLDVIPKYLLMNKSVNLGELGTLRLSFSSEGVEDPKDFNTSKMSNVKVVFTPGSELRKQLKDAKFEKSE